MKKCYIFGTFNPIHNSHIKIADYLLKHGFDKAIFVPAYKPPHKNFDEKQALKRLEMVKLAIKNHKNLEVDDIEFKRNAPSYTFDTIKELYNGERINFAIGTDAFEKIETWYKIDQLKDMLNFLVFSRENNFNPHKFDYLKDKGYKFQIMSMPYEDISSSEIRKKIKNGEKFSTLIDKNVVKYIYEHAKYSNKTYEDILNWLDTNLTQDRYIHTLGTVDTAVMLAERFDLDVDKARIGALLHDCAKCFSAEKLRQILNDTNIVIEDSELVNYKTLQSPVSAFIAENDFGVTDPEILSSIRWHTLGRVKMSDLEKVVFLADKIEGKTRDEDYRNQILQILDKDGIDKAMLECMRTTIKSLIDRNLKICNQTIDVYNRFLDA